MSFTRSVGILAVGTAVGQGIVFLATPLLSRLYAPEDFGVFQAYVSLLSFVGAVATLRYEFAVLQAADDDAARRLVVLCLLVSAGTAAVSSLGLLAASFVPGWEDARRLRPYVGILALSVLSLGATQALTHWFLRAGAYPPLAASRIVQGAGQVASQVPFGAVLHLRALGLVLGDAVAKLLAALSLLVRFVRSEGPALKGLGLRSLRASAAAEKRFPLISAPSALVNAAGYALPLLWIGAEYGAGVLGWFALADRVMGAPLNLISQAVSQVYMTRARKEAREDPRALLRRYGKVALVLALLGLPPCALAFAFGPDLFAFAFGEAWREAGVQARILAPMHYVGFVAWPLIPTLTLLDRQGRQFAWDVGRLLLTLLAVGAAVAGARSGRWAVGAYSAAMLAAYAAMLVLGAVAIRARIRETGRGDGGATWTS